MKSSDEVKYPIVLIGFMGCGKSTLGPRLAQKLRVQFSDLDKAVEKKAGRSIPEIFVKEGEKGFRQRESHALAQLLSLDPHVIALGGGAVLKASNRKLLKKAKANVVWIDPSFRELWLRLKGQRKASRPLLWQSTQSAVNRLWQTRRKAYAACSTLRFRGKSLESKQESLNCLLQRLRSQKL